MFQYRKLNQPILDVATRWNSTFNMLNRLLDLKDFCKEIEDSNNDVCLPDDVWIGIKMLCDALEPVNDATIRIQREDLTIGDFYGAWLKCRNRIDSLDSTFAGKLLSNMKIREKKLLNNTVFLSVILLDPRFAFLLTDKEIAIACDHLKKLYFEMKKLEEKSKGSNNKVIVDTESAEESVDDFEKMLQKEQTKMKSQEQSTLSSTQSTLNISLILNEYIENVVKGKRLPYSTSILDYWKGQKYEKLELYKLSQILMAVPATQVSVERLFSNLSFIYSPLRSKLSENILESIILIRSNHKFNK